MGQYFKNIFKSLGLLIAAILIFSASQTLGTLTFIVWICCSVYWLLLAPLIWFGKRHNTTRQPEYKVPQPVISTVSSNTSDTVVTISVAQRGVEHSIPRPSQEFEKKLKGAVWVPLGQLEAVQGVAFTSGMVYVQQHGRSSNPDSWLIDASLSVTQSPVEDDTNYISGYYTQYSSISPQARRGYLQWLASGRANPHADVGYLFMFLGGLEQRALVDAKSDPEAVRDIPQILAEAKRLYLLYPDSGSFRAYMRRFIDALEMTQIGSKIYEQAPPEPDDHQYELNPLIKVALGQLSRDARPVPVEWMLAWAIQSPSFQRRTPVGRCRTEFSQLFSIRYAAKYGEGLVLPQNKTKLRFDDYVPASFSLRGRKIGPVIEELSDVTVLPSLAKKIQELIDSCTEDLSRYSMHIGKNPDATGTMDAVLKLPPEIWPSDLKIEIDRITRQVAGGAQLPTFEELSAIFKGSAAPTRAKILALAEALESLNVGMEPDVIGGARSPTLAEPIALFELPADARQLKRGVSYQTAELTVALGAALVIATGTENAATRQALVLHIDSWKHLAEGHRTRLKAHLRYQLALHPAITSFKKRIAELPADVKSQLGQFLAALAASDGTVLPGEVKLIELVYKYLELDPKLVYATLHIASSSSNAAPPSAAPTGGLQTTASGFQLDMDKIAQLQKETAHVSELLASVFVEEEPTLVTVPVAEPNEPEEESTAEPGLIGLDIDHSLFLRTLITRQAWSRAELMDLADDMELMLDGALERINEAALDNLDGPLAEGDDPIGINLDIVEGITNEHHSSPRP